ncbi:hypothetical protein GRJ2_002414600 [Grus japonensis]|uniref:Uncharacterized protein n=1 Tax=Grus japonensis TaxID=30415 RepID=A0ABC9XR42_GRUJA
MALRLRLESGNEGSEEEDGDSTSVLESGQAGAELGARAAAERQWRDDASNAVLERLEALEADVRFLCTELGAEKLLWSSRFLELLQEQQGLRQRALAPCCLPPSATYTLGSGDPTSVWHLTTPNECQVKGEWSYLLAKGLLQKLQLPLRQGSR